MLKQLVSRLGHGKQSFHMCNTKSPYLATFVLSLLLFQSACNRETSSKCKKGSFLRISPKTADVTTPSFTGSACQDSDSLPFFPSLSPPRYWPSRPPRRRRRTHPWTRARKSPAHICSTSLLSLPPSLLPSCESAAFHHLLRRAVRASLLAGHQAFSGKISVGEDERGKKRIFKSWMR